MPAQKIVRVFALLVGLGIADEVEPVRVVVEAIASTEEHAVTPVREPQNAPAAKIADAIQCHSCWVVEASGGPNIGEVDTVGGGGNADIGHLMGWVSQVC